MTENMKQFLELVTADAALKAELDGLNDVYRGEAVDIEAMKEKVILIATNRGISLTAADFDAKPEMGEDELAKVAGGGDIPEPGKGICVCPVAGNGTDLGSVGGTCGCVVGGVGTPDRGQPSRDFTCVCIGGGYGG